VDNRALNAFAVFFAAGLMALAAPATARAQAYPSQDVHFIVGFAAGSGPDTIARFVAEKMRPMLGKSVIVENKVGAGGNIATEYVARSKPDGYTLYITGGSALAASGYLFKNPPVNVLTAFDTVASLTIAPVFLVVGPNSPAKTFPELTAILKQKGDKASFGVAFPSARVAGALYNKEAGLRAVEVQYRTSRDWVNDLISGAVDYALIDSTSGVGLVQEGRVRVLAITSSERSKALPDYPTMKEGGVSINTPGWWSVFAPAGTPKPLIAQLNKIFFDAVSTDEARAFFKKIGNDVFTLSPEESQKYYEREYKNWADWVNIAKIEPQ
jgi:tripartite-type tricarboxylate transporter receptor subunit TctC